MITSERPDIYNKLVKKQELVQYIEKIEYRLQATQENERKTIPWVLYLVFLFSFMIGGGIISFGIYNFSGQGLDYFILITLLVVISPIFYLLNKNK